MRLSRKPHGPYFIAGKRPLWSSLRDRRRQIKIGSGTMGKALQRWLDAHQLPAIAAAVLGVVVTISVLLVGIGYLVARP